MTIKTSTFSGWHFSGKDADDFQHQVENSTPNPLAQAAFKRGKKLVTEYKAKGYVTIFLKKGSKMLVN